MKTLHFLRLLLRRDFRRQRLRLSLLLAALVAMLLFGVDTHRELTWLPALSYLADLLMLLIAISLIRADPPERETCLLGVLPIPWYPLALAKIVFLALLIVPMWAVHENLIYRVGMPMRWSDHVALFIDTATGYSWFLGGAILAAALFRWLWLILLVLPVGYGLGLFFTSLATNLWYSPEQITGNPDMFLILQCQELILEWGIGLVAVATLLVVSGTRHQLLGAFVAILGLVAVIGLSPLWNVDFSSILGKSTASLPAENWQHLQATPGSVTEFKSSYWPNEDTTAIYGPFTVTGLTAPFFAEPDMNFYHAVATLSSGRIIEFNGRNFKSFVGGTWEPDGLITSLVGLTQPGSATDAWKQKDVEVFGLHPNDNPNAILSNASVTGTLPLQIKRLRVLGTIPFRDGAALPYQHGRIEIKKISDDGVSCDLTLWQLPLALSGDNNMSWYVGLGIQAIVYEPESSQYAILGLNNEIDYAPGTDDRITAGGNTFITTEHEHFAPSKWNASTAAPNGDWLKNAQISFIVTEDAGKLDVPYAINGLNLGH